MEIQGRRKWDHKDTINLYKETSKSCPLPDGVCVWTSGRKWDMLQVMLWSAKDAEWQKLPLCLCKIVEMLEKYFSARDILISLEFVEQESCTSQRNHMYILYCGVAIIIGHVAARCTDFWYQIKSPILRTCNTSTTNLKMRTVHEHPCVMP